MGDKYNDRITAADVDAAMYNVHLVYKSISDNLKNAGVPSEHELRIWELLLMQAYDKLLKS